MDKIMSLSLGWMIRKKDDESVSYSPLKLQHIRCDELFPIVSIHPPIEFFIIIHSIIPCYTMHTPLSRCTILGVCAITCLKIEKVYTRVEATISMRIRRTNYNGKGIYRNCFIYTLNVPNIEML